MTAILPHVAFIGRAGAGKTTAAELLVKHFGYERLSFAAPLKVGVGSTTDRSLLQNVGVGVRELCPDFWVNLLVADMHRLTHEHDALKNERGLSSDPDARFVVDDCRFPNEAFKLAVEGFVIVRVVADKGDRIVRLKANGKLQDEAQLEHVSETALDDYRACYRIDNHAGPDYVLGQLTDILNREQR